MPETTQFIDFLVVKAKLILYFLVFFRYPPGVDPVKCPNYPFCGTDAASVIVPQLPIPPFVSGVNPFVHPTVVSPFVDQTASHFVDPSVNVVSPVAGSIVPPIVEPITGEASIIEPDSWSKPNVGVASILDPTVKSLQLASITGFPGFYVRRVW